ncbi:MAG: ABC transporter substrate-binding protein [Tractidigestivibacter sp.]|jgi:iron complex transport system substrate-binding protein|uniref:ABC transporter substrate-binding protein n=1 Tax=Tractidigestivibacter sp. TaxID=2847320 RepID=UPI003D914D80
MKDRQTTRRGLFATLGAVVLSVGLAGTLAACSGQSTTSQETTEQTTTEQSATRIFTDSSGREVEIPTNVQKVAVAGPPAQQVMLTMDSSKLCGLATELTDAQKTYFGEDLANLPVFGQIYGGKGDFNKEAVAEAAPDLIIDIGEAKDTIVEDMDALQSDLNIPVIHIEATLDSYDKVYQQLGEILGEEERGNELAEYCKNAYDEVDSVMQTIPEDQRVNVAYLLGDSGLNAIAKGSYQGSVVDFVANNVVVVEKASGAGMGQEVSLEQIASFDPQMIVFGPNSIYDTVASDPAWADITAIANDNYYQVPGEPYNWLSSPPSVNQILGLQWFARVCYPDKFDTSATDVAKEYYKTFYNYDLSDQEVADLMKGATPNA